MSRVDNYEQRFGGIGHLYTPEGLAKLRQSHVCVIGIGGVGSWAVEALMLGIAHTLVAENKHDKAFLKKYTKDFEQFESYLMGTEDKQPKDAEWASKICGVPVETIKQLAADFSSKR